MGQVNRICPSLLTAPTPTPPLKGRGSHRPHVVAIDYGSKRNIFRHLVAAGAKVTVLPATADL